MEDLRSLAEDGSASFNVNRGSGKLCIELLPEFCVLLPQHT